MKGLVVADKAPRVRNFQEATIKSCLELIAAAGLNGPEELRREHINKRMGMFEVKNYDEIYPYIPEGCLLDVAHIPDSYVRYFQLTRIMK